MAGTYFYSHAATEAQTKTQTSDLNNEKLIQLIKHISSKNYTHECIVGDFNLRNINWSTWSTTCGENSAEVFFLEAVRDSYLYQHVEHATRRRGNDDPSLIDFIFTDEEMQVSDVSHRSPLGKSDHSVITFNYHCYLDYAKPTDSYNYRKANYDGMKQHLENSNWNCNFVEHAKNKAVVEVWLSLTSNLAHLRDQFVPVETVLGKPTWKQKGDFAIDKQTREAIQDKKKKHRIWMASISRSDAKKARLEYAKARSKVKTLLRKAKRSFERGIALKSKTNPKICWAHTRDKLKRKPDIAPLLANPNDKSSLKFDDEEKASILLKRFSSVFNKEHEGEIPRIPRRTEQSV